MGFTHRLHDAAEIICGGPTDAPATGEERCWSHLAYAAYVSLSNLTVDLLTWIDSRPRSYEETIETWKTSCPRLSIWDDAVTDGLVRIDRRTGQAATVVLTSTGRSWLGHERETT